MKKLSRYEAVKHGIEGVKCKLETRYAKRKTFCIAGSHPFELSEYTRVYFRIPRMSKRYHNFCLEHDSEKEKFIMQMEKYGTDIFEPRSFESYFDSVITIDRNGNVIKLPVKKQEELI